MLCKSSKLKIEINKFIKSTFQDMPTYKKTKISISKNAQKEVKMSVAKYSLKLFPGNETSSTGSTIRIVL